MITLSEKNLLEVLIKAYEEGWYGSKDMAESYALEAIDKLKEPTNEKSFKDTEKTKKLISDAERYFRSDGSVRSSFQQEMADWGWNQVARRTLSAEETAELYGQPPQDAVPTTQNPAAEIPLNDAPEIQWVEAHPQPAEETANFGFVPDSITINGGSIEVQEAGSIHVGVNESGQIEVTQPINFPSPENGYDGVENIQTADAAPPNYGEQLIDQAAYEDHMSSHMHQGYDGVDNP